MRDTAVIRREEKRAQPAQDDRNPEGGENLHHAGIGFRPHRKAHDQEIDHRPEHEQRRRNQRRRQQGIDGKEREQEEGRVHRDHQEFAVGEVHDVHEAEDQRQSHRDQAVEQPHQKTAGETLDDGLGGHDMHPERRLIGNPVIPGWSEGPDPESRDSGFGAAHRPGMTTREISVCAVIAPPPLTALAYFIGQTASATAACAGKMVTNLLPTYCSNTGSASLFWPISSNLTRFHGMMVCSPPKSVEASASRIFSPSGDLARLFASAMMICGLNCRAEESLRSLPDFCLNMSLIFPTIGRLAARSSEKVPREITPSSLSPTASYSAFSEKPASWATIAGGL